MDPLTIVGSSLSVAKLCCAVGWQLKKFIDGTKLVGTAINALFQDVQSFEKILEAMKDTVGDPKVAASASTGHVGSHWRHLQTSLGDAEEILKALEATILRVNKSANLLNSTRKHIRLMGAQDEIAVYQHQIRSYKDTIQVSLQTTIL
jgi:glutamate formiminotransferase